MATNVLTHVYRPRGAALQLMKDKSGQVLLSGPAGTGKSRACLEKLHAMALKNKGMRALIVRKTAVSLSSSALVTYEQNVAEEALAAGLVEWYGGSSREAAGYRYSNGSVINVGGMDKSQKIMSTEYDIIYAQEATELNEDDWEKITSRLRNGKVSFQQAIADCNPDAPHHWLNQRCQSGLTRMLHSQHKDNPRYYNADGTRTPAGVEYIEGILEKLTGVRKLRLSDGIWAAAEGIIYDTFDPNVHLLDRWSKKKWDKGTKLCQFNIPWEWPRYWSIDFGFTNPMVVQRWACDDDGRLYLYREYYRTGQLVEDVVGELRRDLVDPDTNEWREPEPTAIIADHDAEDRATFTRHMGMGTTPADKRVKTGIDAVSTRLKIRGDGKPRLYYFRDSVMYADPKLKTAKKPTCTQEETASYVWDKLKEAPVKENDHGKDAERYLVAFHDLRGEPNVRWLE